MKKALILIINILLIAEIGCCLYIRKQGKGTANYQRLLDQPKDSLPKPTGEKIRVLAQRKVFVIEIKNKPKQQGKPSGGSSNPGNGGSSSSGSSSGQTQEKTPYYADAKGMLSLINAERESNGMNRLSWDEELYRACKIRCAELQQKFRNVISREFAVLSKTIEANREKLNRLASSRSLMDPMNLLTDRQMAVTALEDRMTLAQENRLALSESRLGSVVGKMDALNPLSVLSRGYTFVSGPDGGILKSARSIKKNDEITLRFTDGEAKATVNSVHRKRKG